MVEKRLYIVIIDLFQEKVYARFGDQKWHAN